MTSYERFKKVFRKKEQICIYGINWNTHGYISNIEPDGVTLVQLNNVKGIKYSWNCFEVIAHAGYKISRSKATEIEDIFEFKIVTPPTNFLPSVTEAPKEVKVSKIEKIIKDKTVLHFISSNLDFEAKEIKKGFVRSRVFENTYFLGFEVGDGVCEIKEGCRLQTFANMVTKVYLSTRVHMYPQKNKELVVPILTFLGSPDKDGRNDIKFSKQGYYYKNITRSCYISTNKKLKALRKHKWREEPFGVGDPVILHGISVGYKTWKSADGFAMANKHADIFLGEK